MQAVYDFNQYQEYSNFQSINDNSLKHFSQSDVENDAKSCFDILKLPYR